MKFTALNWTGLDISDQPVPDGEPVLDYPTAWEICKATNPEHHHERCSYRVMGLLCDCVGMAAARETLRLIARRMIAAESEPQP